jgi:hypothetical protein
MNMTRQSSKFLVVVLGGIIAATAAFAQSSAPSPQSPPAAQDTMGRHGGMMGMMGMMGGMSSDHMQQMSRMMDDCNRMMVQRSERATEPGGENTPETQH